MSQKASGGAIASVNGAGMSAAAWRDGMIMA